MADPRTVEVSTVPTPLIAEGLEFSDGTVLVYVRAAGDMKLSYNGNTLTWASAGFTIPANTLMGLVPPADVSQVYAIVQAGTLDVEVWPAGPGV